ncbi:polysaccharide biosynthesis C-terminal domain-containing protein [Flavobacterium sp. xlx-214]|uniref:lipopolysaccharide biosynthesis protein n=1 Tax=unclassified Flavobacterium TaxID=196869 RepID=UPI0013D0BD9C|nr:MULTISPECIES: polysaccharide biosynthesis C-terminal domain-containing protein [unclassified Flavobacterium]MBA5792147.1 polysaccharide biosynthesis C-terminal domain-containing protein [Flavobacterium sp. xlx-221]QMI84393.1 polysaccharide biosynthesis C-terminal domain-containing protein [Flavobacterium sp. xlx-214]
MNLKKQLHNKALQNSFYTLFMRMMGVAILFGLSSLMTRNIDAVYVGSYEFARVVLLTVATFGLLGTEQSILYFAGKFEAQGKTEQLKKVYLKMVSIVWVCSLTILVFYFIVPNSFLQSLGIKENLLLVLKKCILILPFYTITILNTETIRACNKILLSECFRNIFKYMPILIGTILIIYKLVRVDTLLNWYLYGFVVLAILSTAVVFFNFSTKKIKEKSELTLGDITRISYPMAISSFYTYLLMTIDVFLLAQFHNLHYTAYYAISMKIMSILSMVIVGVNVNFAPKITKNYEMKDIVSLKKNIKDAAKTIAIVNFIIGLVLLIGGRFFLSFFGEDYVNALPAYNILIGTQMIVSLFGLVPVYMNMTGKQQLFHKIMGFAVVINILFNVVLIPKINMLGAAISYAITVLFWNILVAYFSYKKDKVQLVLWK